MAAKRISALALVGAALAALATPALADVKAGVDAWQKGDYTKAVSEWRGPAGQGDADAQFNLGQAYKLGRGVTTDLKLAQDMYEKAAKQGHQQAEANLGLILFQNGDRQGAMPWLQKAADRGEPRAQYVLGTALFNGDLTQKDWVKAYALMTRASAAGLPQASTSLAQMENYIPMAQRAQGTALAQKMAEQARTASIDATAPVSAATVDTPKAPPAPVQTAAAPAPAPARPAAPITPVTPPASQPAQVASAPVPAPAPSAPAPSAAATGDGGWRVQLGAYGNATAAQGLWDKLRGHNSAVAGLQSYLVKAGAVTRLQAGPLATRADAERVCAQLKVVNQPCIPAR